MSKWWLLALVVAAVLVAGCTGDETTTEISTQEGDVEVTVEEGAEGWCPVGTSVEISNPQTGELVNLEVIGTKTVDGIQMCNAIVELDGVEENEIAKIEYLWSEEGESFYWTAYDDSGEIVSEMTMVDGTLTITTEEGVVDLSNFGAE